MSKGEKPEDSGGMSLLLVDVNLYPGVCECVPRLAPKNAPPLAGNEPNVGAEGEVENRGGGGDIGKLLCECCC